MLKIRVLAVGTVLIAWLLSLAGCSGSTPSLAMPGERQAAQAYDPQAPAQARPLGVDNIHRLPGLEHGNRSVVAATAFDTADPQVQALLQLKGSGADLAIGLQRPLQDAVLYVRYDGAAEHLRSSLVTEGAHVALVHEVEPGLLAVALSATTLRGLASGQPLVRLSFAPGRSETVRSSSTITNSVRAAVEDLTIADNGDTTGTLQWSERHPGDYDLNGEVNAADLTKIGQNIKKTYTPASADFAQLEVVDGDGNGEVNSADITVIGQSFKSFITGYNIYRTPLAAPDEVPLTTDTGRWTKVSNTANPDGPSAPRTFNGQDFRLVYTFMDACGAGDFGWYVRPVGIGTEEGRSGLPATKTIGGGAPPDAGLSFEIMPPAGGTVNPGDDIYIAVKVVGATGLFSTNVRFEYDSSILQFVEALPSYNDGTDHPNILTPPLFIGADNVGAATAPYRLLGFNATQTQGTPTVTADGALGYVHFTAIGNAVSPEAIRFPQSSNFIYLWGDQYGVPVLTPALGAPLQIAVIP